MHNISNTEIGISLSVDLKVEAEWKEFLGATGGALTEFFLKTPADAASTGVTGLLKFITSFKTNPSPGYLAWVLAISATAWSLDQVESFSSSDLNRLPEHFRNAIVSSKKSIEKTGIFIPARFFDRPAKLPLYQELCNFVISKVDHELNKNGRLKFKVDAAFNRAVYEVISKRPEYYEPLFSCLNMPGAVAADSSLSWQSYRSKLIYDFEVRPIFGQEKEKISLAQLYVPLRALYKKDESELGDGLGLIHSHEIVRIDNELDHWIEEGPNNDWLRLIGGGPGSGKSTTLKALASRASRSEAVRPLFIPLQHVGAAHDLREAINLYFTETSDSPFNQPPLSRPAVEDGPPLLLIFDGLDELVAPGEAAKDVVGTFANRLNSLVSTLTGGNNRRIRVVVSGRMPAFQAASRYLPTPSNGALEAHGFLPISTEEESEEELWSEDQRERWWKQYALLKGESPEVPEAFSSERLQGITNEPLLCYLLALAGYANQNWELAADNRNRIYSSLVESIYDRGWGDGTQKRLGPGKTLSKSDFLKLMETIALAAWLGGDARVASEEKFIDALDITGAEDAWNAFTADNGQDVTNLAMNFYLKSSERSQRGFEFTHKSFGEYLASKALLSVAYDVIINNGRRIDNAMRDWMRATCTGEPSLEMLHFIQDEIRLRLSDKNKAEETASTIALKAGFQALIRRAADDGFPITGAGSWRSMEVEQGNAECALWMIVNSCAVALADAGNAENALVEITWSDEDDLCSIIKRIKNSTGSTVIFKCLSFLRVDRQHIEEIRAHNIDFSFAVLSECTFVSCDLSGTFFGSIMEGCRFYLCNINSVRFNRATLKGLKFHSSTIRGAHFNDVEGDKILLSPLTFLSARNLADDFVGDKAAIMAPHQEEFAEVCNTLQSRIRQYGTVPRVINQGLVGDV